MRCAIVLVALLLVGCSSSPHARIGGDADGIPVAVNVRYDREALEALTAGANYQRTVVIDRYPFWHGGYHYRHCPPYGYGYGYIGGWYGPPLSYEPSTRLALLLGRGPGEAQYLRARLEDGEWSWTIAMAAGQTIHITIQASGGRSGWTEIGTATVVPHLRIDIDLSGVQPDVHSAQR